MNTYSFAAEFLALIISTIIFAFACEKKEKVSKRKSLFLYSVALNVFCIFLNLLTLLDMEYAALLPEWVNYGINSIYYVSCSVMISMYCTYLVRKLLSHVYDEKILKGFLMMIKVATGLAIIVIVVNFPTGIVFRFTEDHQYQRGPFWIIGYGMLSLMLIMLAYCFRKYYKRIDYEGRKFLFLGIPVTVMLFVYQIAYPKFLLNGTMGAIVACLCYLCFESHREEMDAVTKLGSLSAFLNKLDFQEKNGQDYQVIVVNMKKYSSINTVYGFSKGNEILYYLANWLQNWFPEGDVYRFAPVSFGIILPFDEKYENRLTDTLRQLYENFPRRIEMKDKVYQVDSFFVELVSDGKNGQGSKVMEALEYGIQTAKTEELEMLAFNQELRAQLERKKYLTGYLEKAMVEDRFEVWFQPIYCPHKNKFCSAEALMRLKNETGKYIPPDEFIPLAEETGMIAQISWQCQKNIIHLMKDADELGISQVSVNLSMQQLQVENYMETVFSEFEKQGIDKNKISYEITERMLISKDNHVEHMLKKMIQNGYMLLMDDFGTGYSNFSTVLDYPFQKIKIDKSILYSSEKDNYKMLIMLVQLFHAYGKKIVVEGVETKSQADKLCEIGVDFIQGFYYARPMPEAEYRAFLEKHQ